LRSKFYAETYALKNLVLVRYKQLEYIICVHNYTTQDPRRWLRTILKLNCSLRVIDMGSTTQYKQSWLVFELPDKYQERWVIRGSACTLSGIRL
jgi:hypothetical protein